MGFSDFDHEAFLASAEMQGGFKGLPKWCPGAAFGTKMSDVTVIGRVGGVTAFGGVGGVTLEFWEESATSKTPSWCRKNAYFVNFWGPE